VVPPLLVGLAGAVTAEVAVALLLYQGPGLTRSATTILVVEALALALGLSATPSDDDDAVESLRRRWLFCMVAFLAATLFAASWSLVREVGERALGQGIGLAAVAAVPLYGVGAVLAAMAAVEREHHPASGAAGLGGPAVAGAAVGFLLTGLALPRVMTPASLLLSCLVVLSAAGLLYGAVLDGRIRIRVRARTAAPSGEVRVEDRTDPESGTAVRVLVEDRWIRGWSGGDGRSGVPPWDVAVLDLLLAGGRETPGAGEPESILLVGGGASSLPRAAARIHREVRVDVVERTREVVDLARRHLDTDPGPDAAGRVRVEVGDVEGIVERLDGRYDLVLVDTTAFRRVGGVQPLPRTAREAVLRRVSHRGLLVLGPVAPDAAAWSPPPGWQSARIGRPPSPAARVVLGRGAPDEELLLLAPDQLPGQLERLGEIRERRPGRRPSPSAPPPGRGTGP
jgi:hypothetical protein